jgi:uncharacterized protein
MVIDIHTYIGESLFDRKISPDDLLKNMDRLGIDMSVIIPMKPFDYHLESENDRVAEIAAAYPSRFQAFGRVDPWRKEKAEAEVIRIFDKLNFSGLYINPLEEQCPLTSQVLKPVLNIMRNIRKPVMISGGHVRVSHPRQVEYIAREYPDITFIVTSGGQINICGALLWDAEEMLKTCPNVIMETSGIYRRDFIEQMTENLGGSRIVFGSGTPYYNQEFEMERIKTAQIPDEQKKMLLGQNAADILGISKKECVK